MDGSACWRNLSNARGEGTAAALPCPTDTPLPVAPGEGLVLGELFVTSGAAPQRHER